MLVNMNDILLPAKEKGYAVGFFNAVNMEMARAVIETAEEMNSPVMVGTAEVLLPNMSLRNVATYLIEMAKRAMVPVCVHYDHGLTKEKCLEAVELGFTSIMYDCSKDNFEDNCNKLREITKSCHLRKITVEAELGHVGDNDGAGKLENPSDYFTDVLSAKKFVDITGVDALAIAVGNAHGAYKFPPKLDFDRISEIAKITDIPLVLHGGSGLSDDDFKEAIKRGICKVNIFTDIDKAGKHGLERGMKEGAGSIYNLIPYEIEAMKDVVRNKIELFGSAN